VLAPEVTPGTYLYANQGYIVAATMLEIASGKDWETLVQDEVFTPIRMHSATSLQSTFTDSSPGAKKFYRAKTWK